MQVKVDVLLIIFPPTVITLPPSENVPPPVKVKLSVTVKAPDAVLVPLVFNNSKLPKVNPVAIVFPPPAVVNCTLPVAKVVLVTIVPLPDKFPPTAKVNPPSFTVIPAPIVKSPFIVSVPIALLTPLKVNVGVPELAENVRDANERETGTFDIVILDPILIVTASLVVGTIPVLQFDAVAQLLSPALPFHDGEAAFAIPTKSKAIIIKEILPIQVGAALVVL